MAVESWSTTAASNTTLGTVPLGENTMAPSDVNDGFREMMAQIATWRDGALASILTSGIICMWSGSAASIPSGWYLCDGTNSTPDLRNKFIVGATSTYAVGATGGSADAIVVSHTHTATVTDPGHFHNLPGSTSSGGTLQTQIGVNSTSINATSSTKTTGITVSNSTTGSSATNANLPPYYALCFIMKA